MLNLSTSKTYYIPIEECKERFFRFNSYPFLCEPKEDGEWILIEYSEDSQRIFNRHNSVYEATNTRIGKSLKESIHGDNCILIAEFCAGKTVYDFLTARTSLDNPELFLMIHDVVKVNGLDLTDLPLETRKTMLNNLVLTNNQIRLIHSQLIQNQDELQQYFRQQTEMGKEGIVVKSLKGKYGDSWLKIKKHETKDFVVLGIKKTENFMKGGLPHSFLIGYCEGEEWKPKTDVGSGLSNDERDLIRRFIPALKEHEDSEYIFLKPFFVFEVSYDMENKHRLRSPRVLRIRTDKSPRDCS